MKCKCGNDTFKIEKRLECGTCEQNGAYDDDTGELTYDNKIIDGKNLTRTEVMDGGECGFGGSDNNGCHIYTCSKCKEISEHIFIVDD